jgi:hypothetical protein
MIRSYVNMYKIYKKREREILARMDEIDDEVLRNLGFGAKTDDVTFSAFLERLKDDTEYETLERELKKVSEVLRSAENELCKNACKEIPDQTKEIVKVANAAIRDKVIDMYINHLTAQGVVR